MLGSQGPAQRDRERVRRKALRHSIPRRKKHDKSLLIEEPVATEDHLLSVPQRDVRETLGLLKGKHHGEFLDVRAKPDFLLKLDEIGVVWGLRLRVDLDFEGLKASECVVNIRDCFDQRVETRKLVALASVGVDVDAEVLQFADRELCGEEEWLLIGAEIVCAHAAGVGFDENFERGAGHDGGEEEDLFELVVAGVVLPVDDAVGLGGVIGQVEALFHPVKEAVVVFEGDVVELVELRSRKVGVVLVEEDFLLTACADLIVESCEWIIARRRWRTRGLEVRARLHVLQEAGVHHHVEMRCGWLVAGCVVVVVV